MYKEIYDAKNKGKKDAIIRLSDNAFIPFDPDNTDYQQYLVWISKGNKPLPADEVTK